MGGNGKLKAYDYQTGDDLWTTDFGSGAPKPVISDSTVYVTVDGIAAKRIEENGVVRPAPRGRFAIVEYESGTVKKNFDFGTDRISPPTVAQEKVLITDSSGQIRVFK